MRRWIELVILALALAAIVLIGWSGRTVPPSTHSTFDTGPNGYEALYNVLESEGVPVSRWTQPLGLLPSNVRAIAVTAVPAEEGFAYSARDAERLNAFVKNGGTIVAFTEKGDVLNAVLPPRAVRLDAGSFTNRALERDPAAALRAYAALAGRGPVVFDERVHGYDVERSMWSVFPTPVRVACAIAVAALLLALVGTNVRFAPAVPVEPPGDRDSSDYIASMAQLLRRARAPHVAYERKDHS